MKVKAIDVILLVFGQSISIASLGNLKLVSKIITPGNKASNHLGFLIMQEHFCVAIYYRKFALMCTKQSLIYNQHFELNTKVRVNSQFNGRILKANLS